jgi:hypothetical protein
MEPTEVNAKNRFASLAGGRMSLDEGRTRANGIRLLSDR